MTHGAKFCVGESWIPITAVPIEPSRLIHWCWPPECFRSMLLLPSNFDRVPLGILGYPSPALLESRISSRVVLTFFLSKLSHRLVRKVLVSYKSTQRIRLGSFANPEALACAPTFHFLSCAWFLMSVVTRANASPFSQVYPSFSSYASSPAGVAASYFVGSLGQTIVHFACGIPLPARVKPSRDISDVEFEASSILLSTSESSF